MKKYISIVLLSIYLISFQEVRQVLKLPNLVQHVIKHQLEKGNFPLSEFIKHHYLSGNLIDNDYTQDMNLPFKQMDFASVSNQVFVLYKINDFKIELPKLLFLEENKNFVYQRNFISDFHYSIFQPPEIYFF